MNHFQAIRSLPSGLKLKKRDTLLDFVPAALEVEQSPPNPLGLWLIRSICLFFTVAILWAIFGEIDIVAVAEGTVVPSGQVKTIQASELSVVREIHIQEGSLVQQGDPLITLDATNAGADLDRIKNELLTSRARYAREIVFSDYLPKLMEPGTAVIEEATNQLHDRLTRGGAQHHLPFQMNLLRGYFSDYLSQNDLIDQQIDSKEQELAMSRALVRKAEKTLPILTERTGSLKSLLHKNLVARDKYLELEQQRIDAEEELSLERSRIEQLMSQINELDLQKNAHLSQAVYASLSEQEELARTISALEREYDKASLRNRQQVIHAPISGTVQELGIHTQGAVLEPAQALMQIVPIDSMLEVQAWVLNKDIGFVAEGQPVIIKLATYNFTKYGTILGVVENVSEDAVLDEKKGYRYLLNVRVNTQKLITPDKNLPLRSGMDVVAEVKTGKRNIYEYFIKPLQESIGSSFGER